MLQSKEQIGKLDRRIEIQIKETEDVASNEDYEKGWTTYGKCWARVDENGGGEQYRDDKLTAITMADFYIRHQNGLTEDMRIVYNGRLYNIRKILYQARDRYIKITAESGGEYEENNGPGFTVGFTQGFDS